MVLFVDQLGAFLAGLVLHPLGVHQLPHGFHVAGEPRLLHHAELQGDHQHVDHDLKQRFDDHGLLVPVRVILSEPRHTDAQQQHEHGKDGFQLVVKIVLPVFDEGPQGEEHQRIHRAVTDQIDDQHALRTAGKAVHPCDLPGQGFHGARNVLGDIPGGRHEQHRPDAFIVAEPGDNIQREIHQQRGGSMGDHGQGRAAHDVDAPGEILHRAARQHGQDQPRIKVAPPLQGIGYQQQPDHRLQQQQRAAPLLIPHRHIGHYRLPPLYWARAVRNSLRLLLLMGSSWPCTITVLLFTARTYFKFTRKEALQRIKWTGASLSS